MGTIESGLFGKSSYFLGIKREQVRTGLQSFYIWSADTKAKKCQIAEVSKGFLLLMLTAGLGLLGHAGEGRALAVLEAEAASFQTNSSQWTAWNMAIDKIFAENHEVRANWVRESSPPQADLRPAQLALPVLVWRFQKEREKPYRLWPYVEAIAHSPDVRRIDALMELRGLPEVGTDWIWAKALSETATPEWAFQQIKEQVAAKADASTYLLLFALLDRFALELPQELREPVYNRIRQQWTKGPSNGEGEQYYDLLLRVDAVRARRELITYYGTPEDPRWPAGTYDYCVVASLDKYKGPSPEVAEAARKWLAELSPRQNRIFGPQLRRVLLFADPARELKPTMARIQELLGSQKEADWHDELDVLVTAVLELNADAATEDLAEFATRKPIEISTRLRILDWLVARRYPGLPEIVAWWLREESVGRSWLSGRKEWGDYGKGLLEEAEKINQQRKHT
jgi:hypothetical protein